MTTWDELDAEVACVARASRIEAEIAACEDPETCPAVDAEDES